MLPEQTPEQRRKALLDAGLTPTQQSNVITGVSSTPSPIPVSTITTPQTPLNVQTSTTTPTPDISTISTEIPKPTTPTTPPAPVSDFTTRLQGLEATLAGKTADTATQINQAVSPYETSLNEVNTQIKQLQAESLARQEAILKRPGGTLESVSTEAQIQNRTDAIEALKLSAIQSGLQGNMALAERQAQRMIDAKYGQTEKDLQVARQNIENNWDTLTPAEKKIALATLQRIDKEDAFVKTQREADKTTQGYVASATANISNFTPTAQYKTVTQALQAMSDATPEQALQIATAVGLTEKKDLQFVSGTDNQQAGYFDKSTGRFTPVGGGVRTDGAVVVASPQTEQYKSALSTILGSGKFTKDQKNAVINAINNGEDPFTVVKNQAKNIMGQTEATKVTNYEVAKRQLVDVKNSLDKYYELGGKTNIFVGNYEKVINKLGEVDDPNLVAVATEIASALQIYRNAVSGTAYSVQEGKDIASIFPGINKSKGLNDAILKGRMGAFDSTIDETYRTTIGKSYDELKKLNEQNIQKEIKTGLSTDDAYDEYLKMTGQAQISPTKEEAPKTPYSYSSTTRGIFGEYQAPKFNLSSWFK